MKTDQERLDELEPNEYERQYHEAYFARKKALRGAVAVGLFGVGALFMLLAAKKR